MPHRIAITLDDDVYNIIQNIQGFGNKDATIIRHIIIAYLSEKSYIKQANTKQ